MEGDISKKPENKPKLSAQESAEDKKPRSRIRLILVLVAIALVSAGSYAGYRYIFWPNTPEARRCDQESGKVWWFSGEGCTRIDCKYFVIEEWDNPNDMDDEGALIKCVPLDAPEIPGKTYFRPWKQ